MKKIFTQKKKMHHLFNGLHFFIALLLYEFPDKGSLAITMDQEAHSRRQIRHGNAYVGSFAPLLDTTPAQHVRDHHAALHFLPALISKTTYCAAGFG